MSQDVIMFLAFLGGIGFITLGIAAQSQGWFESMEFYADLEYVSFYINNLYPSGVAIEIPTWLLFGTIAFIWSVRQWKK